MTPQVPNQFPSRDPGSLRLALIGEATEETRRAYLLGFLACDGHLAKNGISINLELQERDEQVIVAFCEEFGARPESRARYIGEHRYLRARLHSKAVWDELFTFYGGRLKRERQFPENASYSFVAGCFDADGCFYIKSGRPEGEFQHESGAFRRGLSVWLTAHEVGWWTRSSRNCIYITTTGCRKLGACFPNYSLHRKSDKAIYQAPPDARWWTPGQIKVLLSDCSLKQASALTGKSYKAVQLKRWRLQQHA